MIALVVSACLVSQPHTCQQDVVAWSLPDQMTTCAEMVDDKLPLWARAHPNFIIQSTWCQPDRGTTNSAKPVVAPAKLPADLPADCPLNSRAAVMAWSHQNPGKSYWQHCRRQDTP